LHKGQTNQLLQYPIQGYFSFYLFLNNANKRFLQTQDLILEGYQRADAMHLMVDSFSSLTVGGNKCLPVKAPALVGF